MYNTQTDKRWSGQTMTSKPNAWNDTIGRWGCLITCLANIIQDIRGKEFTPKDMNDLCKNLKAYAYLNDKTTKESQASNLLWNKLQTYFQSSLKFDYHLTPDEYVNNPRYYYIARVIHLTTKQGHYINLDHVQDGVKFVCFDVEDGQFKTLKKNQITFLHRIIFKG